MNGTPEQNGVRVSVLVPSYNSASTLAAAVYSVFDQTFADYEILVIDDGSTDNTRDVVERLEKEKPGKIRYIYQENRGLAAARNTGIRESRGEFLALLDADDHWLPERLERGVAAMEQNERTGLVHANINWMDAKGRIQETAPRDLRSLSGNMFENIYLRKAHVACPTVLLRKSCCDSVGMFDENLARLGCEDRELWLRVAKTFDVVYLNDVLANYRVSAGSMSRDRSKMMEARMYVIDKHAPPGWKGQVLRRRAVAKIYYDLGEEDLAAGDVNGARKNYCRSAKLFPFSLRLWINLLKTYIKTG